MKNKLLIVLCLFLLSIFVISCSQSSDVITGNAIYGQLIGAPNPNLNSSNINNTRVFELVTMIYNNTPRNPYSNPINFELFNYTFVYDTYSIGTQYYSNNGSANPLYNSNYAGYLNYINTGIPFSFHDGSYYTSAPALEYSPITGDQTCRSLGYDGCVGVVYNSTNIRVNMTKASLGDFSGIGKTASNFCNLPLRNQWTGDPTNPLTSRVSLLAPPVNYTLRGYHTFVQCYNANRVPTPSCITPPSGMIAWWTGDYNSSNVVTPIPLFGFIATAYYNSLYTPMGKVNASFNFRNSFEASLLSTRFNIFGYRFADYQLNYPRDYPSPNNGVFGGQRLSQGFTVDAWINLSSDPAFNNRYRPIVAVWNESENAPYGVRVWALVVEPIPNTLGLKRLRFDTSNNYYYQQRNLVIGGNLSSNTWYHVAAVNNVTHNLIYINGNLVGTRFIPVTSRGIANDFNKTYLNIGSARYGANSYTFGGMIDEVEIFNRSLSQTEIQSIYNAGSAGKCKPW